MTNMTGVICVQCSVEHPLAVPDPTTCQGRACSVFLITRLGAKYLLGCFGSEYDECLFKVMDDKFQVGPDDPICDTCVTKMEEEGKLWRIPGHFLMVPLDYRPSAFLA